MNHSLAASADICTLYIFLPSPHLQQKLSQAGAKHVYAIEASEMAEYAKKLIAGNPSLNERITVSIHSLNLVSFKKVLKC